MKKALKTLFEILLIVLAIVIFFLSFIKMDVYSYSPFGDSIPYRFLVSLAISSIIYLGIKSVAFLLTRRFQLSFLCFFIAASIAGSIYFHEVKVYNINKQLLDISLNVGFSSTQLDDLYESVKDKPCEGHNAHIIAAIAVNRNASSILLDKIIRNPNACLANNQVLWSARIKGHYDASKAPIALAAGNPNIKLETIKYFFDQSHPAYYYSEIVCSPNMPYLYLLEVLQSPRFSHRFKSDKDEWIACNPNTPAQILKELSEKTDYDSRHYRNGYNVKIKIIRNKNTPLSVLKKLSEKDADIEIRKAAKSTLIKRLEYRQ